LLQLLQGLTCLYISDSNVQFNSSETTNIAGLMVQIFILHWTIKELLPLHASYVQCEETGAEIIQRH